MTEPALLRNNRWWEHYAIRYLVPTMTGMLFLRWLQLAVPEFFSPLLPAAGILAEPFTFKNLGMAELLVWAGGGFAFAYLASLPILVFHATRSLEAADSSALRRASTPAAATVFLIGASSALLVAKHLVQRNEPWLAVAALSIVLIFSLIQLLRIVRATQRGFPAAKFASDLAKARTSGGSWTRKRTTDYVTSYRHLREHGNAAFIVLLQAALCALLYACLTATQDSGTWGNWTPSQWAAYAMSFVLTVLWIGPSVAVHMLSQKMEADLISGRPAVTSPKASAHTHPANPPPSISDRPAAAAINIKLVLRILKAVSPFSSWLLPMAFIPPIMLLWTHVANLHYPALLMPAISTTAGLGALLLIGSLVWLLWILCLAFPSLLIAMLASLYGSGSAPRRLAYAWFCTSLSAAVWSFILTRLPAVPGPWFYLVYVALALPVAIAVWTRPPAGVKPPAGERARRGRAFLMGFLALISGLFALFLLLIPLYLLMRSYGKELDNALLSAGVIGFAFLGALVPGIVYTWQYRTDKAAGHSPMSASTFAMILLIPPAISAILMNAIPQQLNHMTLASTGIADLGGESARPALHRLPDKWTDQDRLLTADFPSLGQCTKANISQPESAGWLCGYRNFSFGTTQLFCNTPYADERGQFTNSPLTCLVFVGHQVTDLVHLPKPGRTR